MSLFKFFSVAKEIDTLGELEIEKGRTQLMVMKMAAVTLSFIMFTVAIAMVAGLFFDNSQVDNNEIFKIIGPAFSMIVGAFVGAFATMMGMKVSEFNPNIKVQQMGKTNYKEIAEANTINTDNEIKMMAAVDKYRKSDEDYGPF